ncbi:MAG: outer membrane lipoprotein carrier protein LolA [Prevotellaceae bacterium]|jgi:outer membrane lipoprotein carrier protein|nr:outer membrane lipoprotein carrier protein LolA [Prevotellaceae bacterium]
MKNLILSLMLLLPLLAAAQKPATAEQQQSVIQKIADAASKMQSLVCNFTQTREMPILNEKIVSTGKMYYRAENMLRWEYSSPYNALIINGKKMAMKTGEGTTAVSSGMAYLFRGISDVMLNGISGKNLTDKKRFDITIYITENAFEVVLTPKQAQMKKAFAEISIVFNAKTCLADKVIMKEASGSVTTIQLADKQLNTEIDDSVFAI